MFVLLLAFWSPLRGVLMWVLLGLATASAGTERVADVLYLDPAGNPEAHGIKRFREVYDRHVRPQHPTATFEHRVVAVDTPMQVSAAIKADRVRPPKMIFTADTRIAKVAARELPGIPMVFLTLADPVVLGVTDDPIAPRANVTGYTQNTPVELKHIEILQQCIPSIKRIGVVSDAFWGEGFTARRLLADGESLFGISVSLVTVESASDIRRIASVGLSKGFDAWFVTDIPFNRVHFREIEAQVRATGKPWIAGYRSPDAILAYTPERFDPWPRVAAMMSLVLSGVPAREIPFERPKRFQLIVNRRAAREHGIQIPRSLLVRAHEVID